MNFFKSILSDDPEPPKSDSPHDSDSSSSHESDHDDRNPTDASQETAASAWSFGDLVKTIASRSESVIETYRRDLQEFGSGLKKETEIVREVASRAVKELPTSLEASASAAQGAFDGVLKTTADIISKEALFFSSDGEPETPEKRSSLGSGRYSWFDSQLSVVQNDLSTYCDEPEDVEDYNKWKSEFMLEEKRDEIQDLIGENGSLAGVYEQLVVPKRVDHETFWCRYFYRVDKLKLQEKVRANLVKRAISVDDDEELSWDVDDDEDEEGEHGAMASGVKVKGGDGVGDKSETAESVKPAEKQHGSNGGSRDVQESDKVSGDSGSASKNVDEESADNVPSAIKEVKSVEVPQVKSDEKVKSEESVVEDSSKNSDSSSKEVKPEEAAQVKNEEKVKPEESVQEKNNDNVEEKNDKNVAAAVSSNQSKIEEEDMGWDEIEDIGSDDDKKVSASTKKGSPNRDELRKRLNTEDDDEDLSWDIEDDEEPVKVPAKA